MSPSADPLRLSRPSSVYGDFGGDGAMAVDAPRAGLVQGGREESKDSGQRNKRAPIFSSGGRVPEAVQNAIVTGVRNIKIAP
jgi:hypothetical protein